MTYISDWALATSNSVLAFFSASSAAALAALALTNQLNHDKSAEQLRKIVLSDDEYAAYLAIQGLMYVQNNVDFEADIAQFLERRKGQKRFLMALNSAKIYQYVLGKSKISDLEE